MLCTIKQPTAQFLFFLKRGGVIYQYNAELLCYSYLLFFFFLLFWLVKFSHIIKTASVFYILFSPLNQWSFGVLVPKSRFIFRFFFLPLSSSQLLYYHRLTLPHLFTHTHTPSPPLSPPSSLICPQLALTLQILLQKLVFKNPLCDFCLDFYSECAEYTKYPICFKNPHETSGTKGLGFAFCYMCLWLGVSVFVFSLSFQPTRLWTHTAFVKNLKLSWSLK